MAKHLTEINLDFDMTFRRNRATKEDGYVETKDAVTSISLPVVFPLAPPIDISVTDLAQMDTPPTYMGDADMAYIKFGNEWLPIGTFTEDPIERVTRGRREAQALTRIQRVKQLKLAMERHAENLSEAFKFWVIGMAILGVVALLIVGGIVLLKGSSDGTEVTPITSIPK